MFASDPEGKRTSADALSWSPASALRKQAASSGELRKIVFKDFNKRLSRYVKSLDSARDGLKSLRAQDCRTPAIVPDCARCFLFYAAERWEIGPCCCVAPLIRLKIEVIGLAQGDTDTG